jgi:hypothetical protein
MKKDLKKISNFLFELGMLIREKHRGCLLTGVENPKSVADIPGDRQLLLMF